MLLENESNKVLKAILVGISLPGTSDIENKESLKELERLVQTLGFQVVGSTQQRRPNLSGAVPLGEGKLKEIAKITGGTGIVKSAVPVRKNKAKLRAEAEQGSAEDESEIGAQEAFADYKDEENNEQDEILEKAEAVVFDCELTPSQITHLQSAFGVEVLDRTGVIVEIFSRHAKTREARLQVEIAKLKYLSPRIREAGQSERQGSGAGARGSGETDVEIDKRRIRDRIAELRREIAAIQKEQGNRRAKRSEQPCVALVGYTNAGKSSLMRKLTGSEVLVADKLFATLDTTVRTLYPETQPRILISDTVGFIKKLPHDLVASFRSTLDEAMNASLLLFVVDSSDISWKSQLEVTQSVLKEIGVTDETPARLVLNKSDRLSKDDIQQLKSDFPDALLISTKNEKDIEFMHHFIQEFFEKDMLEADLFVPYNVQGVIGEIRSLFRVLVEKYENEGINYKIRGKRETIEKLKKLHNL
ncbi:GTPase HflX [Fluviispira sanaruensis]|uniref:GTPase HflX n=1 Tax=Fluviispira sanaruensis TaxID=2493639 RepID=A0A4P2VLL5_FLUSA|nr:GTPase HflX [Fluviispira sanaruensis]BBH54253.1 GTPase HflX [Fluviispira sanaruensis]